LRRHHSNNYITHTFDLTGVIAHDCCSGDIRLDGNKKWNQFKIALEDTGNLREISEISSCYHGNSFSKKRYMR
jgi:hypothetical protein